MIAAALFDVVGGMLRLGGVILRTFGTAWFILRHGMLRLGAREVVNRRRPYPKCWTQRMDQKQRDEGRQYRTSEQADRIHPRRLTLTAPRGVIALTLADGQVQVPSEHAHSCHDPHEPDGRVHQERPYAVRLTVA